MEKKKKSDAIAVNKMTIKSQAAKPQTVKQWHLSHKRVIGYVPIQSGHIVQNQREQEEIVWKKRTVLTHGCVAKVTAWVTERLQHSGEPLKYK